ncbi:phosphoribosyltransferase domain-containing protein 1 isoform X2 [Choloepus didactylus]|uniref:phosphoribosyltransferase domain-containing protein 1 isoform X2 n=1 Tax=Choloepus didactylus TaxID=27675 RepID=UPI00189E9D07|nr:phosphoribosyltransferase domain-containing protein 1 isoform X2 [Choloepus didactylus]
MIFQHFLESYSKDPRDTARMAKIQVGETETCQQEAQAGVGFTGIRLALAQGLQFANPSSGNQQRQHHLGCFHKSRIPGPINDLLNKAFILTRPAGPVGPGSPSILWTWCSNHTGQAPSCKDGASCWRSRNTFCSALPGSACSSLHEGGLPRLLLTTPCSSPLHAPHPGIISTSSTLFPLETLPQFVVFTLGLSFYSPKPPTHTPECKLQEGRDHTRLAHLLDGNQKDASGAVQEREDAEEGEENHQTPFSSELDEKGAGEGAFSP